MCACTIVCSVMGTFCTIFLMFKLCLAIALSVLIPPLHHFCFAVFFSSSSHRFFHDAGESLPVLPGTPTFCFQTAPHLSPLLTGGFYGSHVCSPLFPFLKGYKLPRFAQGTVELQQSSRVRMQGCKLLKTRTVLVFLRYIEITLPPT